MADNTQVTAGSGDTIRDVDRGAGVKTQVFLHDVSQATEAELMGLGDSRISAISTTSLTTATTVYTSGDALGTELVFTNLVRAARGAIVQSALLVDKAKVLGAVDLFLFSQSVTPALDNVANAWSDADMLFCLGIVHLSDVIQSANNYVIQGTNLPFVVKPGTGTSIYGYLVTRTANNFFGANGDIEVVLGVLRD